MFTLDLHILLCYVFSMKNIAILISGSGTNMESLIKKSKNDNLELRFIVITDNKNAKGIEKAKALNIPVYILSNISKGAKMTSENDNELLKILNENNIDLILLAGFMRIINKTIIEKYKWKIINIHPSLLPSFKGKDAQKQAFEYGVKISGCTVHFIDTGIDTGPIIMQKSVDISQCQSIEDVKNTILEKEHELYYEVLKLIDVRGKFVVVGDEAIRVRKIER